MRTVKFFVASSVVEFEAQRKELGDFVLSLNQSVYHKRGIHLEWNKPENMSGAFSLNGLQEDYNQSIRESWFFFLIAGRKLGQYTEEEFDVALKQLKVTKQTPKIYPYFFLKGGQMPDETTYNFWNRLRSMGHYPRTFSDWDALKLELVMELERELASIAPEDVDEKSVKRVQTAPQDRSEQKSQPRYPESWTLETEMKGKQDVDILETARFEGSDILKRFAKMEAELEKIKERSAPNYNTYNINYGNAAHVGGEQSGGSNSFHIVTGPDTHDVG